MFHDLLECPYMLIDKELLTYILEYYPGWGNSPEAFLEFVTVTMSLSRLHGSMNGYDTLGLTGTDEEFAGIFLKVFPVDLHPYHDFKELKEKVKLDIDLDKVMAEMRQKSAEEDNFYGLIEAGGILPELETMIDGIADAALTERILEQLAPHLHFR